MKRITVSLTDERCVVLTQIAEKQRRTLGNLCSFLLSGAPQGEETLSNSVSGVAIDPDEVGDYAPERSFASPGVAVSAPTAAIVAPQGVVTVPSVAPVSLDVTAEERAAYALKRSEADRKRRVLLAAMGISHPADAVLPATFFSGERDFAAAHPELAV